MDKKYLINKLQEYYNTYRYIPQKQDLIHKSNYPSYGTYIKYFGSWTNALEAAGFNPEIAKYTYTSEELAGALWDYYYTYGKYPTSVDMNNDPDYPSGTAIADRFGSWDAALQYADMPNLIHLKQLCNRPDICEICGTTESLSWYSKNDLKVCYCCYQASRSNSYSGVLNPNSGRGIAAITEHVVYDVLKDCEKCNTFRNHNAKYDLISNSLGTINVKTSALLKTNVWHFGRRANQTIPDYYICLGFNEDRTEIVKVFQIPGNSDLVKSYGIAITNTKRGLKKVLQYEIDATPYNNLYQNLDIYTLPEFSNCNSDN